MMKKILCVFGLAALLSCEVGVEEENDKDSADLDLDKIENKVEEWGDTAKEKYKDIREDVKDRFDRDTTDRK